MPQQAELPIAVNDSLAESFRLEPITFDLVCRRMAMGREALERQPFPAALKSTPSDTPVTPTGRFASDRGRITSTAPADESGRDIGMIARERLIEQLKMDRDRLMEGVVHFSMGSPRRVRCELAASVRHFRLYDLLIGGDGTDRRSAAEIAWERWWRESKTPSAAEWAYDRRVSDEKARMVPLYQLGVSFDDWEEVY